MESTLDKIYTSILTLGLIALRNSAANSDAIRCKIEADHLHNLPSLIGETNFNRHLHYLNKERVRYVERAKDHDARTGHSACMETIRQYTPYWEDLMAELSNILAE